MGFMDPGSVVWFEISTTDSQAVEEFYGSLLGWSFAVDPDSSVGGVTYTRIMAPGMPFPMGAIYHDTASAEETINVSILSTDVAADQARLEKLGAGVIVPATQVSDVTTFARLTDPQGNVFSIFQNNQTPERLKEFAEHGQEQMEQLATTPVPGSFAWFEIGTTDPTTTEDFYTRAFGWRFVVDDTAGATPYCNIFTGNQWPSAACATTAARQGVTYLMPCFLATELPATTAKVTALGGTVEAGPDTNPGWTQPWAGLRTSTRPRGNRFGLFSPPTTTPNA